MKKIQLSIPEPCHENWNNMNPTEQGRYCNACAKEVIDFSDMSDSEVLNYFLKNKKTEKVCGRAYPDQLDRDITAMPKKKKYWHWYYMLSAFLFFMKPAKTKAQGLVRLLPDSAYNLPKDKKIKVDNISGLVTDIAGNPISYASVRIVSTDRGTSADENGKFSLVKEGEIMKLVISALGYETKEVVINCLSDKQIILKRASQELKEVVVASSSYIKCGRYRLGGVSVYSERKQNYLVDTIMKIFSSGIKIYPNPVAMGSNFTVSMKLKQTGTYTIQVTDAAGRLINELKINASVKDWNQQVNTSSTWSEGVYYVKILDDKGKLVNTGSLVVGN